MASGFQTIPTTDVTMTTATLETWLPREKLRGFGSKESHSYTSGTLWPHGEWSFGRAKRRPDGGEWHEDPFVGMGVLDTDAARAEHRAALPLDLSDVPKSQARPRRGLRGITGYGSQMVKAAGHLMQTRYPHHRKTLGTVTLPPMSEQARREVVEQWPELTRQYQQWLSARLERQSLPRAVVTVTEIQPRRLQAHGEGYLHWHSLWLNQPGESGNWAVEPNDVRAFLGDLIARKCPSYQGGFINVDTKPVDGVVAAYLAKYMSKGRQLIAEAVEDWGEDCCPRTWWNMTDDMRNAVKRETFRGPQTGQMLERVMWKGLEGPIELCFAFLSPCFLELGKSRIIMGWRGRFTEHLHKHILRTEASGLDRAC